MSATFHHSHTRKSRKQRQCNWCAEPIKVGQPNESYRWRDGDEYATVHMHPECYQAMCDETKSDPYLMWSPGDFARGTAQGHADPCCGAVTP